MVVLTCARSGSTLLRLILDAHPDLACPAETNIIKHGSRLAAACRELNHADPEPGHSPAASARIQTVINDIFADYLLRQGKKRWCEKSLGTVEVAEFFLEMYPKAKFICLYRHCMDVIDSGLEATPWGLSGYGFENFVTGAPGNDIAALAAYWCTHSARIADFEEAHPDQCLRVHYEELANDPVPTLEGIFSFLGVASVPGITENYLTGGSGTNGPGDHKVVATTAINTDSVGRGIRIPLSYIHPGQLHEVNSTLARLGYREIDDEWRKAVRPPCLLPGHGVAGNEQARASAATGTYSYEMRLLDEIGKILRARIEPRLGTVTAAPSVGIGVLGPHQVIGIAAYGEDDIRCWRIHMDQALITETSHDDAADTDWLLTGDIGTWSAVLCGYENFSASIRSRAIRYVNLSGKEPANDRHLHARLDLIRALLTPPGERSVPAGYG